MSVKPILAWHFTVATLRDGSPIPPIGYPLRFDGPVVICRSGLHASACLINALDYAPGSMLHRVECGDVVEHHDDKLVCRERTIIASMDAEHLLVEFARWAALQVIDLWGADWDADWTATWRAARSASQAAARAYSRDDTSSATRSAAWGAARASQNDWITSKALKDMGL